MIHEYNVCSEKPLQLGEAIDGWCIYFAYGGSLAVARAVNPSADYQYAVFDSTPAMLGLKNVYHVTAYTRKEDAEKDFFETLQK